MDAQRLRNLTTGILHTDMKCIYEDLEYITGERGIMTHMIPRVMRAVEPWLRDKVTDSRYWDGEYDPSHQGEYDLRPMNESERAEAMRLYAEQPDPLAGKQVVCVEVQQ